MKPAYANEFQKDHRVVRTGTKEGQIGRCGLSMGGGIGLVAVARLMSAAG